MTIFTEEQERAIDKCVAWYGNPDAPQEFYLAGYAGVGKSTVCEEIIKRVKSLYNVQNVATGAYTGKAAYVLRKKGNYNASTTHSMIYSPKEDPDTGEMFFELNPLGPAGLADLIVLDEVSMIDQVMAKDLRSFNKKILVMGDPGQLPPINGEGEFTNRAPDVFLKQIHRQAADSPIIELATLARQGIPLPIGYNKNGVRVMQLTNSTAEEMHNPDTQVICGLNRIRWSVTQMMRAQLGFKSFTPDITERILCCKNDNKRGLFNGGMGVLSNISVNYDGSYRIAGEVEGILYNNLYVDPYLFKQHFDNGTSKADFKKKRLWFDWGYVLTCHKAQGSSFKHATVIDDSDSFRENKWLWLYTAITRSEEGLTILVK